MSSCIQKNNPDKIINVGESKRVYNYMPKPQRLTTSKCGIIHYFDVSFITSENKNQEKVYPFQHKEWDSIYSSEFDIAIAFKGVW